MMMRIRRVVLMSLSQTMREKRDIRDLETRKGRMRRLSLIDFIN
jgi:hypothetical protein